jgi:hypothetical protein
VTDWPDPGERELGFAPTIQSVQTHDSSGRADNEIHKYDRWTVAITIALEPDVAAEGKSFPRDYEIRIDVLNETRSTAREIVIYDYNIERGQPFNYSITALGDASTVEQSGDIYRIIVFLVSNEREIADYAESDRFVII